jgi:hypothetical protein
MRSSSTQRALCTRLPCHSAHGRETATVAAAAAAAALEAGQEAACTKMQFLRLWAIIFFHHLVPHLRILCMEPRDELRQFIVSNVPVQLASNARVLETHLNTTVLKGKRVERGVIVRSSLMRVKPVRCARRRNATLLLRCSRRARCSIQARRRRMCAAARQRISCVPARVRTRGLFCSRVRAAL